LLPVTCSNLDREQHRLFGRAIARAASVLGLRAVLLASGDLSHRLSAEAPAGFSPTGLVFDQTLVNLLQQGEWQRIFTMDDHLCKEAGECGFRTVLILLGALEKSLPHANLLAYEGPFGVGYATVTVDVDESAAEDEVFDPAGYARQVADTFLQTERLPPEPLNFPDEACGCFVCLKREGQLRMCVGEVEPSEKRLSAEIARQTLAALREYASRHPLNIDDLNHLRFCVDLVSNLEPLPSLDGHDPQRYGLLITANGRRSAVLAGLDGVDTPQQQLAIALRRLGLKPEDRYQIQRFQSRQYNEQARPSW
jgi:AMMECR1 domain-containing protein